MRLILSRIFARKPYLIIRPMLGLVAVFLLLMTTTCGDDSGSSGSGDEGTANDTDYGTPDKVKVVTVDNNETVVSFGIITDSHIDLKDASMCTDKANRNYNVIDDINIDCYTGGCLGVVHMGDMIDTHSVQSLVAFRQLYEQTYPGADGGAISGCWPDDSTNCQNIYDEDCYSSSHHRINKAVFPTIGNHDVSKSSGGWSYTIDYIRDLIVDAPGITSHYKNVAYTWRWGRYHFIQLGLWAGDGEYESSAYIDYDKLRWLEAWLKENVGDSGDGVLIFQHYGWDPFSKQMDNGNAVWWSDFQRQLEINVLCRLNINNTDPNATCNPYNVLGIFTGHNHDQAFVEIPAYDKSFQNIVFRDSGAEGDHYGYSIVYLDGSKLKIHTKNIGGKGEWYWWEKDIHLGP